MQSSSPLAVLQEMVKYLADCGPQILHDHNSSRIAMLDSVRRLKMALQTPQEAVRDLALSPTYEMCVRVAVDLDLFNLLAAGDERSASDLADATGSSRELILRLLRVLTAIGFVEEAGECIYRANATTRAITQPGVTAGIIHYFDYNLPSVANIPRFFQKYGYQSPDDNTKGPFQFGHKTDLETYAYWTTQPGATQNFGTYMNCGRFAHPEKWLDYFPAQEALIDGYQDHHAAPLLVDVGGGSGHDVKAFLQRYPDAPGTLVLEDLPETIALVKDLDERIERIGYSFFEKQPVIGARAYFLQYIFHNWPTSICKTILRNLVAAMRPGYSKLLISENVLPARDCPAPVAGLDWSMMANHSGMERSEQQWRDLLATEGLKVVKVWFSPGGGSGVVEAMIDEALSVVADK